MSFTNPDKETYPSSVILDSILDELDEVKVVEFEDIDVYIKTVPSKNKMGLDRGERSSIVGNSSPSSG